MRCRAVALAIAGAWLTAASAAPLPDPCKLVTRAELESIAGPVKSPSFVGNAAAGDVSCEHTPVKTGKWISISLHDGDLAAWKARNGGKSPQPLPEFGKDAFVNVDFHDSVDLYAAKGAYVLRVSTPIAPGALELVKAVAARALTRL